MSEPDEVLGWLREALKDLEGFDGGMHRDERWTQWDHEMRSILRNTFSPTSPESSNYFAAIDRSFWVVGGNETEGENRRIDYFHGILVELRGWLKALIFQVERFGIKSDEMTAEGEAPPKMAKASQTPKRYRFSSPVYLVELAWSASGSATRWAIDHKIHSIVIGVVGLVASIVGIAVGLSVLGVL